MSGEMSRGAGTRPDTLQRMVAQPWQRWGRSTRDIVQDAQNARETYRMLYEWGGWWEADEYRLGVGTQPQQAPITLDPDAPMLIHPPPWRPVAPLPPPTVRELRRERRWTQYQLAHAAGLSVTQVQALERGEARAYDAACRAALADLTLDPPKAPKPPTLPPRLPSQRPPWGGRLWSNVYMPSPPPPAQPALAWDRMTAWDGAEVQPAAPYQCTLCATRVTLTGLLPPGIYRIICPGCRAGFQGAVV